MTRAPVGIAGPHGGGAAPPAGILPLGIFRAEDFGAHSVQAGSFDASGGINAAIAAATIQGGGKVLLDSGLEYDARRPVVLLANCELEIPTGTTLKAAAGLAGDLVVATNAAGVRISGGGTIDANRAAGTTGNAITLTGCTEPRVGVTVQNAYVDNVALVNCARPVLDVLVGAAGRHGVYHSGTTFGRGQITSRDNGQRVAGSGVVFDAASTDNAYGPLVSTDTRAGGQKTQQYGVLEVAASGCDRNTFAPSTLTGNAAGTVSLVGANSGTPMAPGSVVNATLADGSVNDAKVAANAAIASTKFAGYPWHNADLATDVARANLLVNGGLEIWQRSNGPFTASGAYTADRWLIGIGAGATLAVQQSTGLVDASSASSASLTYTHAGTASVFKQRIEGVAQLAGRTVALSVRARSNAANAIRPYITPDNGATYTFGGFHSGGGTFETLTVALAIPANATVIEIGVQLAATAQSYVDNAMLVVGAVAADYVPLPPADDLARCLRYYEKFGDNNLASLQFIQYASGAGQVVGSELFYKADKAVAPTATKVGTWAVVNCGQPSFSGVGVHELFFQASSAGAGQVQTYCNGAGQLITVEANP